MGVRVIKKIESFEGKEARDMTDKEFLLWVHQRLDLLYLEDRNSDLMRKLRVIAEEASDTHITAVIIT